jgi:benzoate 4-monooxygenase
MDHRACVGKNLANMELQVFIATIFRRYTFILENPEKHVSHLTSPAHS